MNNIITISGDPASGKSTVREALKRYFEEQGKEVIVYSTGDIFRKLAREKGMSVTEFNQFLQKNSCNVDNSIDNSVVNLGKKIIEENDDNKVYIIDSRMAWYNIPSSFKVKLTTTDLIAGKRAFEDKTRGKEDRYPSLEVAIEKTKERKQSEIERYITLYGENADRLNDDNFDLVINNSSISKDKGDVIETADEITKIIVESKKSKEQGEDIYKHWSTPQIFLPTQHYKDTIYRIEEIIESIKKNGYYKNEGIIAWKFDDFYFVADGNHRCYAAANASIKFIPYTLTAKDDEVIGKSVNTSRSLLNLLIKDSRYYNSFYLYPVEDIGHFRFSDYYKDVYELDKVLGADTPTVPVGEER